MPLLWGKRDSMNTPHDAVHTLTPLATVRLVAGREIAERLRSRLIWIVTALTTLLVVALIVIPALVRQPAKQPAKPTVVGLMGPSAQALAPALQATAGAAKMAIRTVDVQTSAAARSELKKGSLDVALSVDAQDGQGFADELAELLLQLRRAFVGLGRIEEQDLAARPSLLVAHRPQGELESGTPLGIDVDDLPTFENAQLGRGHDFGSLGHFLDIGFLFRLVTQHLAFVPAKLPVRLLGRRGPCPDQ